MADTAHSKALAAFRSAGEGWWQVAVIVGVLSMLAGGALGYVATMECAGRFASACSASDGTPIAVAVGAAVGVVPALPLLAIAQLYRHLADLEKARAEVQATSRRITLDDTAAQIALSVNGEFSATEVMYIANGETLVDAVTMGVSHDMPQVMLLVRRDEVPEPTRDALRQLKHAKLVFLGGDDVISPAVRAEVASLTCNYVTQAPCDQHPWHTQKRPAPPP